MTPPPEIALLMKAYTDATKLPITLSYDRERTLSDIHARGISPDDVSLVLDELKRLVRSGTKGYTDSSIDWRNSMANVDTLEERVLRLRQRKARIPKPPVSATEERVVGENVISFLQEKDTSPEPERADVRAVFQNIKNNLRRA